jgi:hypothetical protein
LRERGAVISNDQNRYDKGCPLVISFEAQPLSQAVTKEQV